MKQQEIRVRPVTPADAEAVVALWRRVFPEYADPSRPQRDPVASVARKLAFGDGLFWLAERGGELLGTAMAGYDGHRGWLYSVGVAPEARGAGLGRRLVAEAERALAALGCPKVNLQLLEGNEAGRRFWARLGYAEDRVVSLGKRLGEASPSGPDGTKG
ncbi:MAG: GNAT family acetyltransferase [Anaeromyxobacter sp.]